MRIPAPVFGAIQAMSYRELHTGLPLMMRIFMQTARGAVMMLFLGFAYTISIVDELKPVGAMMVILTYILSIVPRWDIFIPIGFRLFSRLLRQP